MIAFDFQQQLLQSKLKGMDSSYIRAALTANEGRNNLAHLVISRAEKKLDLARREFFMRPVITLPFSVSCESLKKTYHEDDGFREIMYKNKTSCCDEVFQYRNYVTIHWLFRKLINESTSDHSHAFNVDYQIVTDGIKTYDYALTKRTLLPFHTYESGETNESLPSIDVVCLMTTVRSIDEIYNHFSQKQNNAGNYIITPYDCSMWYSSCGSSKVGGYKFVWQNMYNNDTFGDRVCSLNEKFFIAPRFDMYVLRIQPYGSDRVLTFTRAHFLKLFGPSYFGRSKFTLIKSVNGFAVLDFTVIPVLDLSKVAISYVNENMLTKGYAFITPNFRSITDTWSMTNTSLLNPNGYYLELSIIDTIKRVILLTNVTKYFMEHVILHIMSFSSKITIVNDKVVSTNVMSPEVLCQLLEYLSPDILSLRCKYLKFDMELKLMRMKTAAKLSMLTVQFISNKLINTSKIITAKIMRIETQLGLAAQLSNISPQSILANTINQSQVVSAKRNEYMSDILTRIEALFPSSPYYSTKLQRKPVTEKYYATALTRVRESLVYNAAYHVSIEQLQLIYDELFPGTSAINFTALQMQAEVGNKLIILAVPYFRVSYSRIYSDKTERLIIPSKLRTSTSADLTGSFLDMMGALMKRNFNRQAAEISGDKQAFVAKRIMRVLNVYGIPTWKELLGYFKLMPITPGLETLRLWADKHGESDIKAAAAIMVKNIADPAKYNAMPKAQTKPILDLTAQGSIAVGQTVVFHSKDVISISVGIFALILERLLLLFPNSIRFAFGADEHTVGEWADKYLDLPGTYIYEFDVPKFDKSQDQTCFSLVLEVMRIVGVSEDFIKYWERASHTANVFNTQFSMVFTLFYGNRSGSGGTLAVNCICLLFAFYSEFENLDIIATLLKGDDSVMVTRAEITDNHVTRLLDRWGFTLKRRQIRQHVSFCSGIFVKTSNNNYSLLRDPVRLLTKLGRGLSPERESSYFIDYYVSFVDAVCQYEDEVSLNNLKLAVYSLYNKTVDVNSIVQFLRQIVVSYKVFLKTLYGFNDETLKEVAKLDSAAEILTYAKQQGFIKSKMLTDICPTLKLPLIEKIRGYTSEMLFDSKFNSEKTINLQEDKTDNLGWVHSI